MGLFSAFRRDDDSTPVAVQAQTQAKEEKKDAARAKARLLETEGKNLGAELNNKQGQSVRKIFG